MARLEDALQYLSPDLIDKINLNPSFVKTGILSAIKDFDPIEAANFIKETVAKQMFSPDFEDIAITEEGGFGGGIDTSGIFSKAGDVALNELGLPVSTANVKDIASVFTDPETGGGDIANMGFELIKRIGKEKALNLVLTQLGIGHPLYEFIMRTPAGADLRTMGGDIFGMTGIPNAYNSLFNKGKNMLGFNAAASDPVITPDPVFTPPPATINEANVPYYTGDTGGSYGGGEDFGSPYKPTVTYKPTMADVAGPSSNTIEDQWAGTEFHGGPGGGGAPRKKSFDKRPRPKPTHHFAQGGLASMARVLRR